MRSCTQIPNKAYMVVIYLFYYCFLGAGDLFYFYFYFIFFGGGGICIYIYNIIYIIHMFIDRGGSAYARSLLFVSSNRAKLPGQTWGQPCGKAARETPDELPDRFDVCFLCPKTRDEPLDKAYIYIYR